MTKSYGTGYGTVKTVLQPSAQFGQHSVPSKLSQYIQPPNSGHKYRPRPSVSDAAVSVPTAVSSDTAAPDQLPDLGRSLTGRQSGQPAPNYGFFAPLPVRTLACSPPGWFVPPLNIPVIYYWGLCFNLLYRKATSVASRHWLIVRLLQLTLYVTNWIQIRYSVVAWLIYLL